MRANKHRKIQQVVAGFAFCAVLLFAGIIGWRWFTPDAKAERAAIRVADAVCVYREARGQWPETLEQLPADVFRAVPPSKIQYDPKKLTLRVPVRMVRPHILANLSHLLRGSRLYEETTTTAITIYIAARYTERHPSVLETMLAGDTNAVGHTEED